MLRVLQRRSRQKRQTAWQLHLYCVARKIVEKESEYPSTYPEELISLAVEDGELVIRQLTDTPAYAVITGFGRYPGSGPNEKVAISKEEFLSPLPEDEVNLDPLFFRKVPVSEVKSAI